MSYSLANPRTSYYVAHSLLERLGVSRSEISRCTLIVTIYFFSQNGMLAKVYEILFYKNVKKYTEPERSNLTESNNYDFQTHCYLGKELCCNTFQEITSITGLLSVCVDSFNGSLWELHQLSHNQMYICIVAHAVVFRMQYRQIHN